MPVYIPSKIILYFLNCGKLNNKLPSDKAIIFLLGFGFISISSTMARIGFNVWFAVSDGFIFQECVPALGKKKTHYNIN